MSRYQRLQQSIQPWRDQLIGHRLYGRLDSVASLRVFMEHHVFAVWDFMSLLKALQRRLTCLSVPWRPASDAFACRLINEIVLAEESDLTPEGSPASHFELYLTAMQQAGAQTGTLHRFLEGLDAGSDIQSAFEAADVPPAVRQFVTTTFRIIESDDVCQIAAAFTFGREELLPDVFQQIVERLNDEADGRLNDLEYYLRRHIELDGDEHGAMARQLMEQLCGDRADRWQAAEVSAKQTLRARLDLWDATADRVEAIIRVPPEASLSPSQS